MGSGKISSSPFSTPSKMARATDSGEALNVEGLDGLNGCPNVHGVGHVYGQGRDAPVRVGQGLARAGIRPLRSSAQGFLDQRLSDAAIGAGHENCLVCDFHLSSS